MIHIGIANHQQAMEVDQRRIRDAARAALSDVPLARIELSIALVDDETIRQLNRRHLGLDVATDVLSFVLEQQEQELEGEVIASAETASREARAYGWSGAEELLLYVIHGTLHLVGYDDLTAGRAAEMRAAEQRVFARLGIEPSATTLGLRKGDLVE